MRKWCDLSAEGVKKIYSKLGEDSKTVLCLTCKKWAYSVGHRLHPFLPIVCTTSLVSSSDFNEAEDHSIHLVPSVTYLLRRPNSPCPWWLVSVEQHSPGKPLCLYHPLTRSRIPTEQFPEIHSELDSIKLSEGLNAREMDSLDPIIINNPACFPHELRVVTKVLLWPNPDLDPSSNYYSVVVLDNYGRLDWFPLRDRQVCSLKFSKGETDITIPCLSGAGKRINDIELWKGKVWAVNCEGKLFGISYHSFEVRVLAADLIPDKFGRGSKRLLVSSDDLYLVCCENDKHSCDEFSVYKLNLQMTWDKLTSIGDDNVLFVGYDTCFFASTQRLQGFPGNCIVYPKNLYPCFSDCKYPDDGDEFVGVEEYLQLRMSRYGKGGNYVLISKRPDLSAVFWPPPSLMFRMNSPCPEPNSDGSSTSCSEVVPPSQQNFME